MYICRMADKKRILVAPLDWGLGHASRCIPLIRRELEKGHDVIIAASGTTTIYLKSYFPQLEFLHLEGYGITYHRRLPAWLSVLLQAPSIFSSIRREHDWLAQLIEKRKVDMVLSDNRYGLWNKNIRCILITHQLFLQLPGIGKIWQGWVNGIIRRMAERFEECHVPDIQGDGSLSGELSHGDMLPGNVRYIGWLSRFDASAEAVVASDNPGFDRVILLSGLEPYRTSLEKELARRTKDPASKVLIIQGVPGSTGRYEADGITYWPVASDAELRDVLTRAKQVICRPGYSTLMDLMTLGVQAELIPTPGQTEQEYLALRMKNIHGWKIGKQRQ